MPGGVAVDVDPLFVLVRPDFDHFVAAANSVGMFARANRDTAANQAKALTGLYEDQIVLLAEAPHRLAVGMRRENLEGIPGRVTFRQMSFLPQSGRPGG